MNGNGENKPTAFVHIDVYPDNKFTVASNLADKRAVRHFLKAAEELIINQALEKSSEQRMVVPAAVMPLIPKKPN